MFKTFKNIYGGKSIYNSTGQKMYDTVKNIHDGHDIYNQFGQKVGQTAKNILGETINIGKNIKKF